jgi:hypothetical protein
MTLNDPLHNGKSHPGSLESSGRMKSLENAE